MTGTGQAGMTGTGQAGMTWARTSRNDVGPDKPE